MECWWCQNTESKTKKGKKTSDVENEKKMLKELKGVNKGPKKKTRQRKWHKKRDEFQKEKEQNQELKKALALAAVVFTTREPNTRKEKSFQSHHTTFAPQATLACSAKSTSLTLSTSLVSVGRWGRVPKMPTPGSLLSLSWQNYLSLCFLPLPN